MLLPKSSWVAEMTGMHHYTQRIYCDGALLTLFFTQAGLQL
jgi:hypothetical protein